MKHVITCASFTLDILNRTLILSNESRVRTNEEFKATQQIIQWLNKNQCHTLIMDISNVGFVDSSTLMLLRTVSIMYSKRSSTTLVIKARDGIFMQDKILETLQSVSSDIKIEFTL